MAAAPPTTTGCSRNGPPAGCSGRWRSWEPTRRPAGSAPTSRTTPRSATTWSGYFRSAEGHAAHLARPVLGLAADAPEGAARPGAQRRHRGARRPAARRGRLRAGLARGGEGARAPGHRAAGDRQPAAALLADGPRAAALPRAGRDALHLVRRRSSAVIDIVGAVVGAHAGRPGAPARRDRHQARPTAVPCCSASRGPARAAVPSPCSSCAP